MRRFNLALKLLWRDMRSGELTLLILALLIAVASSTTISLFADRLQRTMSMQAAEFLAGDLAIIASAPIPDAWRGKAIALGLAQSQTTEFSSVLLENQQMLLVSVKAAGNDYPLRGYLKTADANPGGENNVFHGPEPGNAWVEKRVLSALNLKLGDALTVGEKPLVVSRVLVYEPDKRGDFYSFSPRVMINQADLAATGVIQPGSHVHYVFQFIGGESLLAEFKAWLKPQLNRSQRIMDLHEDRPELGSALRRAERYLGLSSIVVILIAGVAIAMTAGRYTERHFNATALLRCLGCRQAEIVGLYLGQFLMLGILTSAIGCALGWFGQYAMFHFLRPLLPPILANPGGWAIVLGFVSGIAILLGFALPPLMRLRRVSPLRMLRRELAPMPARGWLVYGLAATIISVLIWRYSNDWQMAASVLGIGLVVMLLLAAVLFGFLKVLSGLLPYLGLTWRFGLQRILRNRGASVGQTLAFGVTLAAMVLSFTVRNDLIDNWRQQLPERAPNHFVLNIFPERLQGFQEDLRQARVGSSQFYPVVKGRLVTINGEVVQKRVSKDSQGDAATQRELSLTWAETLPEDNVITAGAQWQADQPGLVSVEQRLAENLKIRIGDQLVFTVGSGQLTASVASIRSLQWDTMKPNFYMVFSPGTLDGFPATYMTSFFLPETQKNLLNELIKRYPAVSILEVDQLLKQFQTILNQLTLAIDMLLYCALSAGFTVLFAAVYSTLDSRIYEGTLMRVLGADRQRLRKTYLIEFAVLGASAGMLAAAMTQAILYVLYRRVMHVDFQADLSNWFLLPIIGALTVGLIGYLGVRQVANQSPTQVLRRM